VRRRATHLLTSLCAFVVAVQASAGIRADRTYPLPNAGFDAGLSGWSQTSSTGGTPFVPSDGPVGGVPSALADTAAPAQARLWQTLPVGPKTSGAWLGRPDEKLELGAAVWIGASAGAGRVRLEVHAATPGGSVVIAGSAPLDVAAAPRDRWLWLHTAPAGALQARVPADATQVTALVIVDASGPVWIDRLLCGRFEHGQWRLAGAGFEGGALAPAWVTSGQVTISTPGVEADAYYGTGYLELGGAGPAWARQAVPLLGLPGTPAPRREAEACAWLHVEADAQLPSQPSASHVVELELLAWEQGSPWSTAQRVAHAVWMPADGAQGTWSFLETAPLAALPLGRSHVAVRVSKSFPGTVRVDHVQLGERHGVDGNPRRHVTAHYVGRYRSPLSPHAVTSPATSQGIWRNWAWTQPPACDPTFQRWFHQPDCAASPGCFRLNGRRDGAVGVEDGPDDLPLAGAYDSRDADVVRYHVRLAEAIGLDSFTYLHQGHTLALQTAAGGGEPLNEQAFETLLDVAEEPGRDLKVAVMYEPKVHLLGWVQGQPTLADKKAGIEADLVHLLDTYGDRKALLKRDGRVVVYVFRNDVCDPTGQQCLDDGDWLEMRTHVEQATGRGLFLVADVPPADLAFDGLSRWQLIALPLLRYRTWSQAASRTQAVPAPGVADAASHAAAINAVAAGWASQDDAARQAIGIAWPGFDDTGVGGWGQDNLAGTDGAPLCVRVAPDLGGAFLDATFEAAVDSAAEWVQVASWNDWNERTHLEPSWSAGFAQAAWSGAAIPPAARQEALGRALRLQAAVAAFQARHGGGGGTPAELERVAVEYLRLARYRPSVVEYD
jgi:hypothetical protein